MFWIQCGLAEAYIQKEKDPRATQEQGEEAFWRENSEISDSLNIHKKAAIYTHRDRSGEKPSATPHANDDYLFIFLRL